MKKFGFFLAMCFLVAGCKVETYQSPDGSIPANLAPYVKPFIGSYLTDRGLVTLSLNEKFVELSANFDVTGEFCNATLGRLIAVRVYPSENGGAYGGAFDAEFALDAGHCQWLPTRVATFHFNKALTGAHIFELSVLLKEGRSDSQAGTPAEYKTWYLQKKD